MTYIDSSPKSWPFEEAKKIINRIAKINTKMVIFETGYGPSGLPHIGTFGEVLRTTLVMHALNKMRPDIITKLYVFSDDLDGLRKVPTNIPNQNLLSKYIDFPLTSVPDPFEQYESFAHHNNAMLKNFLDSFGFQYEFKSSTNIYKSGQFNDFLKKILENFQEILDVMLPSLRTERKQTYSPILPISPITHKILQVHIDDLNLEKYTVIYTNPETKNREEVSILNGNCKLQWKADWGMRWVALGIDYEMNGKDLIDSFKLSSKICKIIGGTPPVNFTYELFLDQDGKKISKSKGNGLSIDDWLKYAPKESLAYYMYQSPKRAKRLYFDVIPQAMDEYINELSKPINCNSAVWHIHNGEVPKYTGLLKFSLLLNLVQACNTSDENVLMQFVLKYTNTPTKDTLNFLKQLVKYAINYYKDFIEPNRKYVIPTHQQKIALEALVIELQKTTDTSAEYLQNITFEVGKRFYNDIKEWFVTIYSVLFGTVSGPKMGSFISLYGIQNTIKLINKKIIQVEECRR